MTAARIVPTRARARQPLGNAPRLAGALLLAATLGACSSTLGELPAAVGGLPAGTPERSATPVAYPAVHDIPPPRSNTVLTEDEQKKAAADLAAARDQQAKRAASSRDQ
jgi:hypothetical protein